MLGLPASCGVSSCYVPEPALPAQFILCGHQQFKLFWSLVKVLEAPARCCGTAGLLRGLTHWENGHRWKNRVWAAGGATVCGQHPPAQARGTFPAFLACVLAHWTLRWAVPPAVPAPVAAVFFLSFITLSSDAGQHQGGVAGTAPVLSSPQPCLTCTGRQGARRQILGYLVTTSRRAVGVWSRCFVTGELTPHQSCRLPGWCCGKVSLRRR